MTSWPSLVERWRAGQGKQVLAAWGALVAGRCEAEVRRLSRLGAGEVVLSQDEINREVQRVVSSLRNMIYGAYALRTNDNGERWRREIEAVAHALRTNGPLPVAQPAKPDVPGADKPTERRREDHHDKPVDGQANDARPAGDSGSAEDLAREQGPDSGRDATADGGGA